MEMLTQLCVYHCLECGRMVLSKVGGVGMIFLNIIILL